MPPENPIALQTPGLQLPDFRSAEVLRAHIAKTMAFYHPRCIDPDGGFFHYFKDDGTVYERGHRHLVSSTRFVFNYAMAAREFTEDAALGGEYLAAVRHGLRYLREAHRNPETGGYAWTLRDGEVEDATNHCYGVAFVLLAYSCGLKVGIEEARGWMDETWQLLESRFWESGPGLYRDEADAGWNFGSYRGQNANMHMCEAMLAAYEASGERRYFDRALKLADHMTRRQAALAGGLVWEHYDADWNVDWTYHLDDPKHLFRPWGFQPGHQTEWTKLLLILDRHATALDVEATWLVPTARRLFDAALEHSWDVARGGMVYGFAFEGLKRALQQGEASKNPIMGGRAFAEGPAYVCDDDKYFWVQAESLAAAALLAHRTGDAKYWDWYGRLWAYAWTHMVDHEHGAWYRILDVENRKYGDEKSPAGKTDYHTMGACHEVLNVLR
ncbi:AGE family epimerase/isomerase [Marilutibacter chinensis]|uniref:AGE family epimerase/isomerase n=1 Tax=Marilutibacter chinensis TaxID=2912247 RepID=A0ABS9HWR6_9GAMM|nr:AGE family epimerase/isomerase [Lysobacter chinensis]MCF7223329.1 AGE family epimerase/isomerase [Lysobacter chinensis]